MKTQINDVRHEHLHQSSVADGDYERTNDTRTVYVHFNAEDYAAGIPELLDPANYWHYGKTYLMYVRQLYAQYERTYTTTKGHEEWRRTRFALSGPNCRKDGSPGERGQGIQYPTRSHRDTGRIWTEDDVTVGPGHYLYQHQKERVGKPVMDWLTDELPEWLAKIEQEVSPITGTPFRYGDEHRFGSF